MGLHSLETVLELLGERKLVPDLGVFVNITSVDVKDMPLNNELSLFGIELLARDLFSIAL